MLQDGATHLFIDCGNVGMWASAATGTTTSCRSSSCSTAYPIVTDCGAYLYTASREWRNRFRSTAFHSTIQVDGEEVNRFIGPDALWQLHDDATPDRASMSLEPAAVRFRGAHLGYQRLPQPVRVMREVVAARGQSFVAVADALEGGGRHEVVWRFPLEPGLQAEIDGEDVRFEHAGISRWFLPVEGADVLRWTASEPGWVSPRLRRPPAGAGADFTGRGTLPLPYRVYLFSTRPRSSVERRADARSVGLVNEGLTGLGPECAELFSGGPNINATNAAQR